MAELCAHYTRSRKRNCGVQNNTTKWFSEVLRYLTQSHVDGNSTTYTKPNNRINYDGMGDRKHEYGGSVSRGRRINKSLKS